MDKFLSFSTQSIFRDETQDPWTKKLSVWGRHTCTSSHLIRLQLSYNLSSVFLQNSAAGFPLLLLFCERIKFNTCFLLWWCVFNAQLSFLFFLLSASIFSFWQFLTVFDFSEIATAQWHKHINGTNKYFDTCLWILSLFISVSYVRKRTHMLFLSWTVL